MAYTLVSTKKTVFGNKKIVIIEGTFANGDTTGAVATGLSAIDFAVAQYDASAKILNCSASGGDITLATQDPGATKTFHLIAIGH